MDKLLLLESFRFIEPPAPPAPAPEVHSEPLPPALPDTIDWSYPHLTSAYTYLVPPAVHDSTTPVRYHHINAADIYFPDGSINPKGSYDNYWIYLEPNYITDGYF